MYDTWVYIYMWCDAVPTASPCVCVSIYTYVCICRWINTLYTYIYIMWCGAHGILSGIHYIRIYISCDAVPTASSLGAMPATSRYIHVSMYVCMYMYVHVCTCTRWRTYVHVCTCVYMYTLCMYVYLYIACDAVRTASSSASIIETYNFIDICCARETYNFIDWHTHIYREVTGIACRGDAVRTASRAINILPKTPIIFILQKIL